MSRMTTAAFARVNDITPIPMPIIVRNMARSKSDTRRAAA